MRKNRHQSRSSKPTARPRRAIVTDRNSPQQQAAIARFLAKTNFDRRLFRWTKDPHQILVAGASRTAKLF
jgi:hypothetical protein